jgi:hypothetical protein
MIIAKGGGTSSFMESSQLSVRRAAAALEGHCEVPGPRRAFTASASGLICGSLSFCQESLRRGKRAHSRGSLPGVGKAIA